MTKKKSITAFYLETILMILIFVCVILILTRVFSIARMESVRAERTTTAVLLAENAAEAALTADSEEDLAGILQGTMENAPALGSGDAAGKMVTASFDEDLTPSENGPYRVEVTWETDGWKFVRNTITVRYENEEEAVYVLNTGSYKPKLESSLPESEFGPVTAGKGA
ncbi:MAG: hypothetical protein IJH77_05890 [Mogibacterium sp.]|nr:hypothetical protein [Mogibacterium sp.]